MTATTDQIALADRDDLDEELSPIARCLVIAAGRGRALRLARERANGGDMAVPDQVFRQFDGVSTTGADHADCA